MAYTYKIYKQLIPVPMNASDPSWARRQVWVLKINSQDVIDELSTLTAGRVKRDELTAADPTGRVYKIVKVDLDGTEPDLEVE